MFLLVSVPHLVTKSADIIPGPPEKSKICRRSKSQGLHEKCDKVGDTLFVSKLTSAAVMRIPFNKERALCSAL